MTWTNASTRVRSGLAPIADYLRLVGDHLGRETDPVVFDSVLRRLLRIFLPQWTAPEAYADAERVVAEACATALAAGDPDRGLAAMRGLARASSDVTQLRDWLARGEARPGLGLDRDTRWLAVARLASLGELGADDIARESAADVSSSGHQAALRALAGRPEASAKAEAWSGIIDPATSNRDFDALVAGIWTPGQEGLCTPYLERYLQDAPRVAERSQSFAADVAFATPRFPMALPRLESFRDQLEAAADATTNNKVLRRGWRDTVDELDVALRVRRTG